MRAVAFNEAEAVFERFWDLHRCDPRQWCVGDGVAGPPRLEQAHCQLLVRWERGGGVVAVLSRGLDLELEDYDHLCLCASVPDTAGLTVWATVDGVARVRRGRRVLR